MSNRHSTRILGVFLYTHPAYILAGKQNKNRGQIVYLLSPLVSFDNTERHRCHIKPTSHNNGTTSSLITKKTREFLVPNCERFHTFTQKSHSLRIIHSSYYGLLYGFPELSSEFWFWSSINLRTLTFIVNIDNQSFIDFRFTDSGRYIVMSPECW